MTSPPSSLRSRVVTGVVVAALVALGLAVGIQKIRSFDYWWHLRTGALIVETGRVPQSDPYTYTVPGARWIDIHWLFQIGLHGLHSLGGHTAVILGKLGLMAALCGLLATVGGRRQRPAIAAFALGLMLLSMWDRLMPRPELPSFVLLAGVLALLERHDRRGDGWVFAVVPLQLIWANVHGLFAVGIAVCAIYAAAELVRPVLTPGAGLRRDRLLRLSAVTALSAAVAVHNPNGLDGALYPIQQLGMIGPVDERGFFGSIIAELVPPLDSSRVATSALLLPLVLGASAALAMVANWRHLPGAHPLLWVAFGYLALGAQRNLALFAVIAVPIVVRNANEALARREPSARAADAVSLVVAAALAVTAMDVGSDRYFERIGASREAGFGVFDFFYPSAAVDWIERERPPGRIAHHMGDGGYLAYRLWPDYEVMSDGRLEVFGPERFARLMITGPETFRALDDEYDFGAVLLHYSLFGSDRLLRWLHLNTNWRLVSFDDTAALYVRVGPDGSPQWPEVDVDDPAALPPLDGPLGAGDRMRRMARTHVFTALQRYDRALAEWEAALERYPDHALGPAVHAMLLQRTGKAAAAEAILRRLLRERGDDPRVLAQIGDLRLEGADLPAARELYDRALALNPQFAYAALRRGTLAELEGDADLAGVLYTRVLAVASPLDPVALQARRQLAGLGGGMP